MKYFKNITSLADLKTQFKTLALANHPDRGGKTEIMQEINNEYDILFPIWKDKDKDTTTETAQSTRRQFYTDWGWEGENYNINLRMTDITKIIREYVKEKYPTYKFSVTARDANCITIALMEAPQDVFIHEKLNEYDKKSLYIQVNRFYINKEERLTELCIEILENVKTFAQTYNYDDSDPMTDYFNTNFYLYVEVGKWDKPFKVVEKQARIKTERETKANEQPEPTEQIPLDLSGLNIQIVDYSEKAIAVYGDTKTIKEQLKNLGGKFNRNLKDGAGWVFSKKRRESVEKLIEQN